jgi:hypothetical protein
MDRFDTGTRDFYLYYACYTTPERGSSIVPYGKKTGIVRKNFGIASEIKTSGEYFQ